MMSEIFDIFRKCPNRLNFLQGVYVNKDLFSFNKEVVYKVSQGFSSFWRSISDR